MSKYIIAGGRDFNDENRAFELLYEMIDTSDTVLSGGARGADAVGEKFAKSYSIALDLYPADWGKYGKGAGFERNARMAEDADVLLAFWDGKSKGTKHMIDCALEVGLEVHVWRYNND